MGVYEKDYLGAGFFYVGRCALSEWVVGGGGLDGYFREQRMPESLERFHRGCVGYLSR